MTPERYQQVNHIFHEALNLERERRAAFLDWTCASDPGLRREVQMMLDSHEVAGDFMAAPAFEAAAGEIMTYEQSPSEPENLTGQKIGHYQVLSHIGAGGMGDVYLAQDSRLGRRVALKLLPQEFTKDRDRVRRFEQEAKAASALNHPNIVTIHEIGHVTTETGSLHFIAEEYIEGQTLRRRIKQEKIPLLETLEIATQSANALQVAHAAGIVHRDIKPENIMLRPDGFIKILDFGLAKLTEPKMPQAEFDTESPTVAKTLPGTILGTAAYMSPEQARGLDVDARSDIWSLGVVIYEMIAGQAPFKGMTPTDVLVAIVAREPQSLSLSSPKPPHELERIVRKALAKNRDERYQTAKDLAIDLKSLKRQLELDAEIARIPAPDPALEPAVSVRAAQFQTDEHIPRQTSVRTANAAPVPKPAPSRVRLASAVLLTVIAVSLTVWWALRPQSPTPNSPPAPERQFTYWLTVQQMRDGKEYKEPYPSTGQEPFEVGWKFKLNFISPQSGSLYILNETLTSGGAITYRVLFPFPSINNGSAQIEANHLVETGRYDLTEQQGVEKLLLIWATQPAQEMEAVKGLVNPKDLGLISVPAQLNAVREFLARRSQSKPAIETDNSRRQINVRGRDDVVITQVKLERR
ncbi:MAG: serine/threonine protein kinase [Blastocatellales bacterium]